jgi:hypothetical protein
MSQSPLPARRNGELPPGTVDGFCPKCRRETIADEADPRCSTCGVKLHAVSLPSVPRRIAVQVSESAPKTAEAAHQSAGAEKAPQRAVRLRRTRQAWAWDRATDQLLAAAEHEEREAEAVYQRARARYEAARQEAHRIRQLRELVRVEESQPALPAPKVVAKPSTAGKRWSRHHDACVNCGTTNHPHASKGRCRPCYDFWSRTGQDRPTIQQEATTDGN